MNINIYSKNCDGVHELTFIIREKDFMFSSVFLVGGCNHKTISHINMASGPRAGHRHLWSIEGKNRTPSMYTKRHMVIWLNWMKENFPNTCMSFDSSDTRRAKVYANQAYRLGIKYKMINEESGRIYL